MKRKIVIKIRYTNNLLELASSHRRVPCLCNAIRVLALKSSAAGRDATFAGASLIFARLVSARGESPVIEEGKSIGRRSGWPFRFNGPRWNGLYQRRLHAFVRAGARAMHNTDSFHVATSGGARLPGLPGITDELSPIDKKSRCFPLEQRHGTSKRYIHKWRRDLRYCFHIRDLRYFFHSLLLKLASGTERIFISHKLNMHIKSYLSLFNMIWLIC